MRTYAGHSSPAESNALYRNNLSKGQTGLSVAFDLPTQTGYDPDDELAVGEVGKVGVPVTHIGDMRALFDGIPLDEMNTSMTINATAMWLLALYQAVAEEHGHDVTGANALSWLSCWGAGMPMTSAPVASFRARAPGEWSLCVCVHSIQRSRSPTAPSIACRCESSSGPGSISASAFLPTI